MRRLLLVSCVALLAAPAAEGAVRPEGLAGIRAGEALAPGATRPLRWRLPEGADGEREMELVLSLDGGATFALRVSAEETPSETLSFRVPNLPTRRGRLGLRLGSGREGDERLVALSEPFAITPDPAAPLEALGRVRGESATLDAVTDRAPRLPDPGLSEGAPVARASIPGNTELEKDDGASPILLPGRDPVEVLPACRQTPDDRLSAPLLPAVPLFRPKRE